MRKFCLIFVFLLLHASLGYAEDKALRVISLAPSTTEILFALGLDQEIVAVSRSCNYPPQALTKEKVGTFSDPDIEKILSLKPDLIVCTGLKQAAVVTKLKQLGLKVCVSDPANFEELFASIKNIAALTGRSAQADTIVGEMRATIKEIRTKVKKTSRNEPLRVYVEIWHGPLVTAGKNSFISEILQIAGAVNIADSCAKSYFDITAEAVIAGDPQAILVAYMDNSDAKLELMRRPGWKDISAIRNSRVYNDINSDIFLRPSPRLADGLKEIYKRLYGQG